MELTLFVFAATATNVIVRTLTSTSVLVSWEVDSESSMQDIQWVVYYGPKPVVENNTKNKLFSWQTINLPGSNRSVMIRDLHENAEYLFEVASTMEVNGSIYIGSRVLARKQLSDRKLLYYVYR